MLKRSIIFGAGVGVAFLAYFAAMGLGITYRVIGPTQSFVIQTVALVFCAPVAIAVVSFFAGGKVFGYERPSVFTFVLGMCCVALQPCLWLLFASKLWLYGGPAMRVFFPLILVPVYFLAPLIGKIEKPLLSPVPLVALAAITVMLTIGGSGLYLLPWTVGFFWSILCLTKAVHQGRASALFMVVLLVGYILPASYVLYLGAHVSH